MSDRLLAAAVAFTCLGIGCDDPEVQGKVESVLLHGVVQAQASCSTPNAPSVCGESSTLKFRVHLFQDGSSFMQSAVYTSGNFLYTQFNSKEEPLHTKDMTPNGYGWIVTIDEGSLTYQGNCIGGGSDINTLDISTQMTCTGFNLEAFGIDP